MQCTQALLHLQFPLHDDTATLQEDGRGLAVVPKGCPERQPFHIAALVPTLVLEIWDVYVD